MARVAKPSLISDSEAKARLGTAWADKAGMQYKYYMVFEKSMVPGAYSLDQFMERMEEL